MSVRHGLARRWSAAESVLPVLLSLLALAFALRWGLALSLPNIHRPDEIFQTLEPAYRLWSGAGVVTWEWREGIRSMLFPGFLAGLMALSGEPGSGAARFLPLIAAAMSVVSLSAVAVGVLLGWRHSGAKGAVLCGLLPALWPDLVYLGPKTLTEVQAGNILILAAGIAVLVPISGTTRLAIRLFAIGALLGLAFALRFHLAPAVLLVAAWVCRLDLKHRWPAVILGGALPVALMGVVDLLTWGSPFQSVWRNFQINLLEGVSGEFGVQPPYWYGLKALTDWGAAVVPLAVFFLLGVRHAPLLAATAAVVVLSHSAIGHKEISFIHAALPPALIVAGLGTAEALRWF
jgi:GPI mannosyltransferase 3